MDYHSDIDPALLAEFIDESLDFMDTVDNLFVQLEASPTDLQIVESIFRPVHSIKGNSSFFGFDHIKTLSHEMETLLDLVRKGTLPVSQPLIQVLLEGVDALKHILARCRKGLSEVDDAAAFDELVDRVKAQSSGESIDVASVSLRTIAMLDELKEAIREFDEELIPKVDLAIDELRSLVPPEPESGDDETRNEWPEALREIMHILANPIEELLADDKASEVQSKIEELKAFAGSEDALAGLDELLENCEIFMTSLGFDGLLQDIIVDKLHELDRLGPWKIEGGEATAGEEAASAETPEQAPEAAAAQPKTVADTQKTMRVSEAHIDMFLSFVGELLVVGDMFHHLQNHVAGSDMDTTFVSRFKLATDTFTILSDDLQKSIMSIRKVAVQTLFQKVPRLVRDIAASSGKQIVVKMSGEELQVDKSLMDLLDAPMTHMVRNACDHGIETPEVREAAGKTPEGTMTIAVVEEASTIVFTVDDDGAGIDFDAIKKKAISLGFVAEDEQLTSDDLVDFMFRSGVSTAKEVTDVSGRGVGMDVVKRMIQEAGGKISVSSERGKGSHFQIVLPKSVTTQIMQGFLVESDGQCFVMPMNKVHETSRTEENQITVLPGEERCVTRHGKVMQMMSLRSALGLDTSNGNAKKEEILITVNLRQGTCAIGVDKVLGVQKVVVREISGLVEGSAAVAGGALMGDGSVALILDMDKLHEESNALS